MKALSIKQPWAWAIVRGFKPVENRSWSTNWRGKLLIHAGRHEDEASVSTVIGQVALQTGRTVAEIRQQYADERRFGGIVGSAILANVVKDYPSPWFFGPHGFVLVEPRRIAFAPLRGQLGLFDVDAGFAAGLSEEVES